MRVGLAVLWMIWCGFAYAERPGAETDDRAVMGVLNEWKNEVTLTLCFDQARLMMFGAHQKELGRPIETFVDSGALPRDSTEYKFVLDGYSMGGFMDDASKAHFLECAKPAFQEPQ